MTATTTARASGRVPRKQSISWVALLTLMVTQIMVTRDQFKTGNIQIKSVAEFFYGPNRTTPDVTLTTAEAGVAEEEPINVASGIRAFRNAQASLQREALVQANQKELDGTSMADVPPRARSLSAVPKSTPGLLAEEQKHQAEQQRKKEQEAVAREAEEKKKKEEVVKAEAAAKAKEDEEKAKKEAAAAKAREVEQKAKAEAEKKKKQEEAAKGEAEDQKKTEKAKTEKPTTKELSPITKPNDKFTGSKITRLSMGMDLFENVCISRETGSSNILSYSEDAKDMKSTLGLHRGLDNLHVTHGRPLDSWYNATAKWPLIKGDVLFTQALYGNPGHCISDYMFPVIRDRYERKTLPVKKGVPEYSGWVRFKWRSAAWDFKGYYCSEMLKAAGYVDEQGFIFHQEMCFERLYMPATEQYRFPVNQELLPIAEYETKVGGTKLLLPGGINSVAPEYPREALLEFRRTLWENMGLKSDPWTDREVNVVDKVGPRVLLYNRFGSKQRHWGTSLEVAKILQKDYHVSIDVIGEEWNSMNFTQQAHLYNSYSHVATVHGAHMTNLIFSRPGTKVVEVLGIAYKELRPDESLKRREDAKDQRDWYGPLAWFSAFTRQLGIEHFSLPADDHIKSVPGANAGMDINATRAANFIANRFALKARDNTAAKK